jgi:hypothetical protein
MPAFFEKIMMTESTRNERQKSKQTIHDPVSQFFCRVTKQINHTKKEFHVRKIASAVILFAMLTISTFAFVQTASADDVKMVGAISKIELSADGKTATAILKDTKTGESVTILVTDELTLDKFKDKRIVEGDEIRCKFEKVDGKNNSKMFKKTAGC